MKYLREDLKTEYKRLRALYPNIEYIQYPLMNISDIFRAYFILADYFSDTTASENAELMLFGIRDASLLISALTRQTAEFAGKRKYSQPLEICATLFFGLVKNHAFVDGNKRTALLTLLYQLDCYSYCPKAPQRDFEKLVIAVASNTIDSTYRKQWRHTESKDKTDRIVEIIARLLKDMTTRKNNAFHMDITPLVLQNAINRIDGCDCIIDGSKIRLQRRIPHSFLGFKRQETILPYSIPYRGNTRPIGAATIREALQTLELYEQYPDYKTFFEGADPRYMLINQFEGPLRRLKDR